MDSAVSVNSRRCHSGRGRYRRPFDEQGCEEGPRSGAPKPPFPVSPLLLRRVTRVDVALCLGGEGTFSVFPSSLLGWSSD